MEETPYIISTDSGVRTLMIGGWGSDRQIAFVSFVRACERSCAWPRGDVASVAGLRKLEKSSAVPRALSFAAVRSVEEVFQKCLESVEDVCRSV